MAVCSGVGSGAGASGAGGPGDGAGAEAAGAGTGARAATSFRRMHLEPALMNSTIRLTPSETGVASMSR